MPLMFGLPSMRGGLAACAGFESPVVGCPDAPVIDSVTTAVTAAATIATVAIELTCRRFMRAVSLIERVLFCAAEVGRFFFRSRTRAAAGGVVSVGEPRGEHQRGKRVVAFVTPRFVIDTVEGVALLAEVHLNRPRPRNQRRILDGDFVNE